MKKHLNKTTFTPPPFFSKTSDLKSFFKTGIAQGQRFGFKFQFFFFFLAFCFESPSSTDFTAGCIDSYRADYWEPTCHNMVDGVGFNRRIKQVMDSCHRVTNLHTVIEGQRQTCRKTCPPGVRYLPRTNTCGCSNPAKRYPRVWPYNPNGVRGCRCDWGWIPNGNHTACQKRCKSGYNFFMNKSRKPRCCPNHKTVRGPSGAASTGQVCCSPKPSSNSRWSDSDSCSWYCLSKPSNSSYLTGSCRWRCNSGYTQNGSRCCVPCTNGYASSGSCVCRQVVVTACTGNTPCGVPGNCNAKLLCPDGVNYECNTADCPSVASCNGSLIRCGSTCVVGKLCAGSSEKVCPSVSCSPNTLPPVQQATPAECP